MSFILQTHMITQHMCAGQCTYCCDVSSKAFSLQIIHIAHQSLHNGEHLYYVGVCNKTCCKESFGKTSRHTLWWVYRSCGVCRTAFSDERNLLNLPSMIFFYILDDDDAAAYNLKKMMINSVFILCTDIYHISVKLHLCKDVC